MDNQGKPKHWLWLLLVMVNCFFLGLHVARLNTNTVIAVPGAIAAVVGLVCCTLRLLIAIDKYADKSKEIANPTVFNFEREGYQAPKLFEK